jgi:hypothetical protein
MATSTSAVTKVAYLISNTDLFNWKGEIVHLPANVANASLECKELFMNILNGVESFNLKKLTPQEQKAAFNKAWLEYKKHTPLSTKDKFIKTTLLVIEIAGMTVLFVIGTRACL